MNVGSFKSTGSYLVRGVTAYAIDLSDKHLTYREVNDWAGKDITIDGREYSVRGVETFKPNEDMICPNAGILVGLLSKQEIECLHNGSFHFNDQTAKQIRDGGWEE